MNPIRATLSCGKQVKSGSTRFKAMPSYKREGIKPSRIGVVLPEKLKEELQTEAKARGWSISQTAAYAIQEWLKSVEKD